MKRNTTTKKQKLMIWIMMGYFFCRKSFSFLDDHRSIYHEQRKIYEPITGCLEDNNKK